MDYKEALKSGLFHGLIDGNTVALEAYKPRLLINDIEQGEKVLSSIIIEMQKCDEFFFSVAFVTNSGITVLLNMLQELEEKGVRGKIIASQYQNFTEPKALKRLIAFSNIDLRIVTEEQAKMHTKGYIFRKGDEFTIIVGSSNLTQSALCENKEWNLKVSSTEAGALVKSTLNDFNRLYFAATVVDDLWIAQYSQIYNDQQLTGAEAKNLVQERQKRSIYHINRISPNKMQVAALEALTALRSLRQDRALIISATGTGKTYLAAFDVKKFESGRFLFVVHRETIARAAMKSFEKVIGAEKTMSVLSGWSKNLDADYLFATIQTLSKDDMLQQFRPDTFDYIVIDEVHRAGASSYQKIIAYFQPKFLLGMSATPERNDDFDIFQLFNYNVAYEIRLQQAMKENMICPFHYFGVREIMVEGELIDDHSEFNRLTSDERVRHIIEKIEFYGFSGDRVKGLIFCSRKEEAKSLSAKFNKLGYKTTALTGDDSQNIRDAAIDAIECADRSKGLDYIFTVDVFNEGVDIPSVNQVVMLRPTQSAIIFVQQLGRGLRKNATKEYVVVIDFIGNYEKNFLIPIALSGDHSYNKDTIKRYVAEGNRVIPGCSTVNFDHVTRDSIYASIDKADFNDIKLLKDSYFLLKQRLGRIPKLREFEAHGAIDVLRIIDKKGSYYQFLKQYDPAYEVTLTALEMEFIEFVSSKLANGKKVHELEFLSLLMSGVQHPMAKFSAVMQDKYGIVINDHARVNLVNMLTNNFATGSGRDKYAKSIFIEDNGSGYVISGMFAQLLDRHVFKEMITELIDFGIDRFLAHYAARYKDTNFQLYQKYTYEDVCRCLDWAKGEVALNIGGYKFNRDTKTFPVFINYNKSEDVSATINYEDRFISPSSIIAISKSGRSEDSEDVRQIYNAEKDGVKMFLFVRKNKDDKISKEFYFLGSIKAVDRPTKFVMRGTKKTAVEIKYQLETAVRQDIYEYIID